MLTDLARRRAWQRLRKIRRHGSGWGWVICAENETVEEAMARAGYEPNDSVIVRLIVEPRGMKAE